MPKFFVSNAKCYAVKNITTAKSKKTLYSQWLKGIFENLLSIYGLSNKNLNSIKLKKPLKNERLLFNLITKY